MNASAQKGLSLIELMVALALGTLVLFTVLQIYLSGSDHAAFNNAQQQNQSRARFILDLLQSQAGQAGYVAWQRHATAQDAALFDFVLDREGPFPSLTDSRTGCSFADGKVSAVDADGKGLCVRYQRSQRSDAQFHQDCSGGALYSDADSSTPQVLVSHLYVSGSELHCKTNNTASAGEVVLATGIHDLRFESASVNQVRVGLVLTSTRLLLPENCTYQDPLGDQQKNTGTRGLCSAFAQSLYLRNQP
ncbi:prepilin-type N-terminal cleavage/methylation domain-containing protein [Pseudomonas nicosulfuronedens]|uniref:Prepilin-type N-terminal cleavage/methylation domain-containing protein n=1 Tax=Pseudomonas nicosulfuronedens TaxID=2571105 RepID=A0A5R9RSE9_9PSED|nr:MULTISPECIES: prepilin-type N-terminal cleavage/methylation domain-containing protein [Pseudomonas]MDH1007971.1 prepilin-type N-terminal cleavage/methylation domain-containing protein [Pseudomonas nicosulfuronedens]MDH1978327.1 prepilin-type N-terminal cleavage/methylation domain-containing protein [Pseudomonas nicosulfuronedens]MDH2025082.1 prepilin-type N-terminal cleavage/methylation domain-containing protein [Pseudomonas nicosulfuronedens]TLX80680.1 prepilin-type N-terminal cleavage/meth